MRTYRQILKVAPALWTFQKQPEVKPVQAWLAYKNGQSAPSLLPRGD
ncbi:MAG: hypothetical protein ACK6AD_09400 [Cyanobacteriota bacterium]